MIKDMTQGSEIRHILVFTVPMLIGNVFQQLYSLVDMAVVGKYVGSNALGAVGSSFPIIFVLVSAIIGLTTGSSILVSQLFGAGQIDKVKRAISTMLTFTLFSTIIVSVVGVTTSGWLVLLIDTPPEMVADATIYLRIIFGGILMSAFFNTFSAIFRSLGDSRTPLYFLIIASLTNVALDIVFVALMDMGVAGVALATILAQGLSVVLCVLYIYWRRIEILKFHRHEFVFDRELFGKSMKLGIPVAIQQTVISMGFIFIQRLINSFGAIATAAITAATRIENIATMPAMNISMAISTFTGQNIGAGRIDRVHRGYVRTLLLVGGVTAVTMFIVLFAGPWMLNIFLSSSDPNYQQVLEVGVSYLSVMGYFLILLSIMFTTNGVLNGAGDVMITAASSVITLTLRVVSGYVMKGMGMGVSAIWWSIPVGWILGVVICQARYFAGSWKHKSVVSRPAAPPMDAMAPAEVAVTEAAVSHQGDEV